MTGLEFLKDTEKNCYTRLKTSPIHGVGVFAIRDIPKGTNPFKGVIKFSFHKVKQAKIRLNQKLNEAQKQLIVDMCPEVDGYFYVPSYSINEIGVGYYLNHDKFRANMKEVNGGEDFVAKRDIDAGEELLVDYGTYSAENL